MIFCIRIKLRMNIHQVLFFCFLSELQGGDTGLTNVPYLYAGAEGGSGSLQCYLTPSRNTTFFCKGECKEENILIKTDDVTAQSGRYSIEYEDGSSGRRILTVYITQLTKSDSGRYRFGLGRSLVPDYYCDFNLRVTDEAPFGDNSHFVLAGIEGESAKYGCIATVNGSRKYFCKGECEKEEDILVETEENIDQSGRYSIEYTKGSGLYVTITQLKKSDTGRYKCGYGRPSSPDSSYKFPIFVVDAVSDVSRPGYFWPLVVCVPVIVVLVAVVLLFVYKLKMRRNSGLNTRETSDSRNKELSVHYENRPPVHYENHPPVHYENRPPVHYENRPPVSMSEDPDYQSLDAAGMDPDHTYSTLRETANK